MPPRTVKRGAGPRRTGRATRGSQKVQNLPPPEELPEESGTVKEAPIPATEEEVEEEDLKVESEPVVEEKPPAIEENPAVAVVSKSQPNGLKKEDEKMKDSVDEYGKHERLELEDNDPESETEEYGGVDDDEKEIYPEEDVQEVGDEEEEEDHEENLGEEDDDGDEEELEDGREEIEVEEYEERADVEQVRVERADADEAEHHEVVKERRKRKEFEIFVGGLDKEASEGDLRKVFSAIGEITEVRLLMNPQTKKNKGFAFLRFAKVEQAKRAVAEMKHPLINGKKCGVSPSQDSDTLFLGNICKSWTKEALKEKLKHYGVENVEDLTLVDDSNSQGMNRGFAFLEFSCRSEAMDAFKRLQKRDIVFGVDRPAKVSFADSFIDPGDEIMAQVKTVFVDGLPATWDEDRVRGFLKKYGEIVKVELARNMPSAKRKDFGFVTFGTHDAAVTCAKSINNAELGEGETKVKVRARLSRPLQKGKGKHGGRGGDFRSSRASGRSGRGLRGNPSPRKVSSRGVRSGGGRAPPPSTKRSSGIRDRRPVKSVQARPRPLPPSSRSYDRRPPVSSYPKSSLKREYSRREEIPPPRSRPASDYSSRVVVERRPSYRDEYSSRDPVYPDPPRTTSRTSSRRAYVDDEYSHRYERLPPPPLPSYREVRGRDYDAVPGSKRPYSSMDEIPPRYADSSVRHSRARIDYEYASSASQYGDGYGDRLGRSNLGYSSNSRTSQDSHGMYSGRSGMGGYGASYGGHDVGGMYSSSYGSDYVSRSSDVGGSSYSSLYSGRGGGGGSSYIGNGGSGSYY